MQREGLCPYHVQAWHCSSLVKPGCSNGLKIEPHLWKHIILGVFAFGESICFSIIKGQSTVGNEGRNVKEVVIYTDGACSGNPGPGGWGAILMYGEHRKELSGGEKLTTNNRMELTASIEALQALKEPCKVKLYSDSAYLVNGFRQGWIANWQRNGWRNSRNEPVENQDLWKKLLELMERHSVEFIKVKGHSDNEWNNRCDELAREAIQRLGKE